MTEKGDHTFEDHATAYCVMVENKNDKQYIMFLAQALDRAYARVDRILDQQIADAKADVARLTGISDAAPKE